jgi:ribonuclease HI
MTATPRRILVYCDGSCEPQNPGGWATWAWVAYVDGREVNRAYGCLGHGAGMSNNVAEYEAVLQALRRAARKAVSINIRTDSQLVVKQVLGEWAVKAAHLQASRREAATLLRDTRSNIAWVPREENGRADALSKLAYRQALATKETR